MGIKSFIVAAAFAVGAAAVAMPAVASPISGSIDLVGSAVIGGTWANPTSISFIGNQFNTPALDAGTGDLSFIPGNTFGTIKNLTNLDIATFVAIPDFYSISVGMTTLSFSLDKLTDVVAYGLPNGRGLTITGIGEFNLNVAGKDPTKAAFSLTTQCVNSGCSSTTTRLSFSATTEAVPEPATIALLGAGLAGFGLRRKKRAA